MSRSDQPPLVGFPNAEDFRRKLAALGFSQNNFAKFIGVDDSTVRQKWARDDPPVPLSVWMLLCIMESYGITTEQARHTADLEIHYMINRS